MKKLFVISCALSLLNTIGWASISSDQDFRAIESQKKIEPPISNEIQKSLPLKSVNKSGYVLATNLSAPQPLSVSDVSAEWIVPKVNQKEIIAGVEMSVGMGGCYAGTSHGMDQSLKQRNFAFFSLPILPNIQLLALPISIGDHIAARVFVDATQCHFIIRNKTKNQTVTRDFPIGSVLAGSQFDSAAWLIGDPRGDFALYNLVDFGKVSMTKCKATINGKTGSITNHNWEHARILMISNSDVLKVKLSKLQHDGTKFSATFKHD